MRSHDMKTQYPLESGNKKATSGAKLCTGTQENRHILKSLCAVDCKRSEHYPDLWNPILAKMKKKKKKDVLRESLKTQVSYRTKPKVNLHKSKFCLMDENKLFFFLKLFIQCCLCDLFFVRTNVHYLCRIPNYQLYFIT